MECAAKRLGPQEFGEFIAIVWECWNGHNCFIFGRPDGRLEVLGDTAVAFVRSYHEQRRKMAVANNDILPTGCHLRLGC